MDSQVAVKAVIQNTEGKFLIVREGGRWQAAGGRLESGEKLEEGLRREVGIEGDTENGCKLNVEFTERSADAIRRHGVRRFLEEVQTQIPEVKLINFENVTAKLAVVTLRGEKAKGNRESKVAFGRDVTDTLDAIVTRIVG